MAKGKSTYSNLRFNPGVDWQDVNPKILVPLNMLAKRKGQIVTITSGYRATGHPGDGPHAGPGGTQTQWYLWENAKALHLVHGITVAYPGSSDHQRGAAVDAVINGRAIGDVWSSKDFSSVGLKFLPRDRVHVTYASSTEGGTGGPSTTPPTDTTTPPAETTPPPAPGDVPTTTDPSGQVLGQQLASSIGTISQVGGAPLASAPLVGDQGSTYLTPQSDAASSWQLIASNGPVSQDTIRLAQLASYGQDGSSSQ